MAGIDSALEMCLQFNLPKDRKNNLLKMEQNPPWKHAIQLNSNGHHVVLLKHCDGNFISDRLLIQMCQRKRLITCACKGAPI